MAQVFKWRTKKEVKRIIRELYNSWPKEAPKFRFLLSNEAPMPFESYKSVKLEYCSGLEKFRILLVDEKMYNHIIVNNGARG